MKTYKYKCLLSKKTKVASLIKQGNRCFLYLDNNEPIIATASWSIDRYEDFDFYHILEPFINKDVQKPSKEDVISFLKRLTFDEVKEEIRLL
tara:strand:+ start:9 stop:284 length:276 start_codon:yes stop_codon:yes gene_type:complete